MNNVKSLLSVLVYLSDGVFLGCFANINLYSDYNVTFSSGTRNTPNNCSKECQAYGFLYAGLQDSSCMCYCTIPRNMTQLLNEECGLLCPGDVQYYCGGRERKISFYNGKYIKLTVSL